MVLGVGGIGGAKVGAGGCQGSRSESHGLSFEEAVNWGLRVCCFVGFVFDVRGVSLAQRRRLLLGKRPPFVSSTEIRFTAVAAA